MLISRTLKCLSLAQGKTEDMQIFQCGFFVTITRKRAINYVQYQVIPSWNNWTYADSEVT